MGRIRECRGANPLAVCSALHVAHVRVAEADAMDPSCRRSLSPNLGVSTSIVLRAVQPVARLWLVECAPLERI